MADMTSPRTPMPQQDPAERARNFQEVALGYTPEMAIREAGRCLHCKRPFCVEGCPVNVRIPDFIARVADGDFEAAYQIITSTNGLPAISGLVCPQDSQCEAKCVRGVKVEPVAIGRLERFVADWHLAHSSTPAHPAKANNYAHVAVVGSGPAGLTCAYDLAQQGYPVTLFEAFHTIGGVLVYGIPEFRLPKAIVHQTEEDLRSLGVQIRTDMVIGRVFTLDELFDQGFRAVFLATGAGLPKFMGIPGEGLAGVYSANEYLTRINLMHAWQEEYDTPVPAGKKVAVVGGGNVAMDAARCARRLGAEVHLVYRRGREEMPARAEEVEHAMEEGIHFHFLTNPTAVIDDGTGRVCHLSCIRMELGEPDEKGRRRPMEVPGSDFLMEVDTVVMALGTSPNPLIRMADESLEVNRRGCFVVDEETMRTSREGVYAGGDAVTGAATVILAMGAGKKAAKAIMKYLDANR